VVLISPDVLNNCISAATTRRDAQGGPVFSPSSNVFNCIKMLAVEAHNLHATIGSLEQRALSLTCGFQHILKVMSSSESEDVSTKAEDNFWDFFSCKPTDLKKWNNIVQANIGTDGWIPPKLSKHQTDDSSSAVETNDDISELDFYASTMDAPSVMFSDSENVDSTFESLAQVDQDFGFVSSPDPNKLGDVLIEPLDLVSQIQKVPGEGSDAMLIKDGEEDTSDVARSSMKTIGVGMSELHELTNSEHQCAPISRTRKRHNSKVWFPCLAGCVMACKLVTITGIDSQNESEGDYFWRVTGL